MVLLQLLLGILLCSMGSNTFAKSSKHRYGSKPTRSLPTTKNLSIRSENECGKSDPQQFIYERDLTDFEAKVGEFGWMVSMYVSESNGYKYIGAATLLNFQTVLTASNLIEGIPKEKLTIAAGEWDTNQSLDTYYTISRNVQDIKRNEGLAILFLKLALDINLPHIRYMCLPTEETVFEWEVCKTTAWMTSVNANVSNILRKQDYRIMSQLDCGSLLPPSYVSSETGILDSNYLCAMDEMNNDSCMINAGAALFCPLDASAEPRYVQAGIALVGTNCGIAKSPALFISITKFMPWIELQLSSRPSSKVRKQRKRSKELRPPIKPAVRTDIRLPFRTSAYSIRYKDNIQKENYTQN